MSVTKSNIFLTPMGERELKNKANELYWKGWSYDEIAKHLKISWAEVINYLEVDYYN